MLENHPVMTPRARVACVHCPSSAGCVVAVSALGALAIPPRYKRYQFERDHMATERAAAKGCPPPVAASTTIVTAGIAAVPAGELDVRSPADGSAVPAPVERANAPVPAERLDAPVEEPAAPAEVSVTPSGGGVTVPPTMTIRTASPAASGAALSVASTFEESSLRRNGYDNPTDASV